MTRGWPGAFKGLQIHWRPDRGEENGPSEKDRYDYVDPRDWQPLMEKFAINDLELTPNPPAAVQRDLTRPLETCDVALNYYELEPGDAFASAYHHHQIQEELFYVIAGTVTFETTDGPVEVGPGEVVRFPRGEYQRGTNHG